MVVDGSPLAVVGIFVSILRERFATGGVTNYQWKEDVNQTEIAIESSFAESDEVRNFRPAIFIDKEQTVYGKTIIGDRVEKTLTTRKDVHWCLATIPLIIDCVSSRRGESTILGDVAQWTIHAASDIIQGTFGFHSMSAPQLGRTVPYEADKKAWTSPITFQIQYNVRWSTVPIAPLLQEIALHITADTNAHFQSVATTPSSSAPKGQLQLHQLFEDETLTNYLQQQGHTTLTGISNPRGVVVGKAGQLYIDIQNNILYICLSAPSGTEWVAAQLSP
ncbi:MAG: hypothetical protein CMK74_00540 [Pseudomonadales bacterium]|nr:hypothetical protein [Pseudomonadales bacterium]|tara:strand:+ start:466 stop:1296 length:831 start_codon:yes stop_codon:yes gene_type:complete